jgi:hypothetical protein
MKDLNRYLDSIGDIGETLYYPGAGNDFQTLKLFVENSSINQFYYSDYNANKINFQALLSVLGENWTLISKINLLPIDFRQKDWGDFWYNLESASRSRKPDSGYAVKYAFKHYSGKEFTLIYLGTESIKTYLILLDNNINIDLIVIQDHGSGDNWSLFGNGKDLESIGLSSVSNYIPKLLFIGKNTIPWDGYEQITKFEGTYGSAGHPRALFQKG